MLHRPALPARRFNCNRVLLLAVQAGAANHRIMLIFALALAAAPPAQLTDIQQRDIGCVALFGLVAYDQKRKAPGHDRYPDVQEKGRKWAGIVGDRVTAQSGLPAEIIGIAINEAVKAEQAAIGQATDPRAYVDGRMAQCSPLMDADLAGPASAGRGIETTQPVEPYQAEVAADMADQHRVQFCRGLLKSSAAEVARREGADSRDAKALARLVAGLDALSVSLPLPRPGVSPTVDADQLAAMLEKEPGKEDVMARCIRLGEAAANRFGSAS